jgi:hypothetical protein
MAEAVMGGGMHELAAELHPDRFARMPIQHVPAI